MTSREDLGERGSAWVNLVLSGTMTRVDLKALALWRAKSPAHEQAFIDAVRFHQACCSSLRLKRYASSDAPAAAGAQRHNRWTAALDRRALLGGAVTASAAGVLLIHPPAGLWPSLAELLSEYRTGAGESRKITAASGVSLELNTRTNVTLGGSKQSPKAELISGEAEVTAERSQLAPFTLLAGAGRTLLKQAKIDVLKVGDSICVTCVDGHADVDHKRGDVQLRAGYQVTYTNSSLGEPVLADVAVVTAWRNGLLIFKNAPLQHVVNELNRYRSGKIILLGEELGKHPVFAVFRTNRMKNAAHELEKLTGAKTTYLPGDIVILS